MKHSLVAIALLAACLAPSDFAAAQSTVQVTSKVVATCGTATYSAGAMNYPTQDTTGATCTSASVVPSGTQDTNLKQVNGATVNVGTGAAGTGTQRVTTSTDSTIATVGAVTAITNALPAGANVIGHVITDTGSTTVVTALPALPAGTAILGSVGIDQTTPGTTNGVQTLPSSAATAAVTPSISASSAATSLIAKASAGNYYDAYCQSTAVGNCIVYNSTTVPGAGALTAASVLECAIVPAGGQGAVAYGSIPRRASTGIVILFSSSADCNTYTASSTAYIHASVQ